MLIYFPDQQTFVFLYRTSICRYANQTEYNMPIAIVAAIDHFTPVKIASTAYIYLCEYIRSTLVSTPFDIEHRTYIELSLAIFSEYVLRMTITKTTFSSFRFECFCCEYSVTKLAKIREHFKKIVICDNF